MTICVLATAAREAGALTILKQFLSALQVECEAGRVSKEERYLVLHDPTVTFPAQDGVTFIPHDTGGVKRFTFDFWGFRKLMKVLGERPDVILSFQNTAVNYPGVPQMVYFHNIVSLTPKRWNPLRGEERRFFLYQLIYPRFIKWHIRPDMEVVVQAQFMKALFQQRFGHPANRITVIRPPVQPVGEPQPFDLEPGLTHFVYPVKPYIYKRFDVLAEAAAVVARARRNFRIHLTFLAEELPSLVARLDRLGVRDVFVFHAQMPHPELMGLVKGSAALLFPSEMETLGLPLQEAAGFGVPILCHDMPYAHETVAGYNGITYIKDFCIQAWADAMLALCDQPRRYAEYHAGTAVDGAEDSWVKFFCKFAEVKAIAAG